MQTTYRKVKLILEKSQIKAHTRTLASGAVVNVKEHSDKRSKKPKKSIGGKPVQDVKEYPSKQPAKIGSYVNEKKIEIRKQMHQFRHASDSDEAMQYIHPSLKKRLEEETKHDNSDVQEYARATMANIVAPAIFRAPQGGGKDGEKGRQSAKAAYRIALGVDGVKNLWKTDGK